MSYNSRGKGQCVAIRWMRRPIDVLIWIILLSVAATLRHISKFLSGFVFCLCRAIFPLPWANSNSQGQEDRTKRKAPVSHCHERIQTARDRTTLGPEEKKEKNKKQLVKKNLLPKKKKNSCCCTYLRVSRLAGGKA